MPDLYDAHLHFQFDALVPHHATVVADLIRTGVRAVVVNATNEDEFPLVASLCAQLSTPSSQLQLLPSYGIHPWDCGQRTPHWLRLLRAALLADPRAGVGEIGLDRWIIDGVRADDPRIDSLTAGGGRAMADVPVFMVSTAAGEDIVARCGGNRTLMDLRKLADEPKAGEPASFDLADSKVAVAGRTEERPVKADSAAHFMGHSQPMREASEVRTTAQCCSFVL